MTDESLLYEHVVSRPLLVTVGFKKLILDNNKKTPTLCIRMITFHIEYKVGTRAMLTPEIDLHQKGE